MILVAIPTFNTIQQYIIGIFGRGAKLQSVEFVYFTTKSIIGLWFKNKKIKIVENVLQLLLLIKMHNRH